MRSVRGLLLALCFSALSASCKSGDLVIHNASAVAETIIIKDKNSNEYTERINPGNSFIYTAPLSKLNEISVMENRSIRLIYSNNIINRDKLRIPFRNYVLDLFVYSGGVKSTARDIFTGRTISINSDK